MSHILLISKNNDFAEDLKTQVMRFAPDFSFVETYQKDLLGDRIDRLKMAKVE